LRSQLKLRYTLGVISVLIILIILAFRQCGGNQKLFGTPVALTESYHLIPAQATLTAVFDTPKLLDDIDFEEYRKRDEYLERLTPGYNANPTFSFVFANPRGCGIDTDSPVAFYIEVGTKQSDVYSASILKLASVEAFEKVISQTIQNGSVLRTKTYNKASVDQMSHVAWTKDFVVFLSCDASRAPEELFDDLFSPSTGKKYYTSKSEFHALLEEAGSDISVWLDLESYARNQILAKNEKGEIDADLLKGGNIFGKLTFAEGYVDFDIRLRLNEKINESVLKLFKSQEAMEVFTFLPERAPSFIGTASIDMKSLMSLFTRDIESKIAVRNYLVDYGLVIDDFTDSFTGNVLIASYPVQSSSKISLLMAIELFDKTHFGRLIDVWLDLGVIAEEGDNTYRMSEGTTEFFPLHYTYPDALQRMYVHDNVVYISLDESVIESIKSRASRNVVGIDSVYQGFNIDKLNGSLLSGTGKGRPPVPGSESIGQKIDSYAINYYPGQLVFRLNMKESGGSSLRQLINIPN